MTEYSPAHAIEVADGVVLPEPVSGERWVVGALIVDAQGRVFVQRRSSDRQLFPGCWDIVGGHVEGEEGLLEALSREVTEETGWNLATVEAVAGRFNWRAPDGGVRCEFDVVATVRGDLRDPRIDWTKHTDFRWIGHDDVAVLREGRAHDDTLIHDLVVSHFAATHRHHARGV